MSDTVDLTNCDREPIHVPGSIQPHGALIAMDGDLVVRQASANLTAYVGGDVLQTLGKSAHELLGRKTGETLAAALAANRLDQINPMAVGVGGRALVAVAHRHLGRVIVELEPDTPNQGGDDLRGALARMSTAKSLAELFQTLVHEVGALTGFDRVLVYRFGEDGAGHVIAERRDPRVESYLDLHYPASDIPAQARRLYLVNWLRYIPDARYLPVPLVPSLSPDGGGPLDLTYAQLRGVSPIHIEYLANMGLGASMSISLVVRGKLWGLVSCGNVEARHLPYSVRTASEVLGRLASAQIAAHEEVEQRTERLLLAKATACLVDRARTADDVLDGLAGNGTELMKLVSATGVAVLAHDVWKTAGEVPPESTLRPLLKWLGARQQGGLAHSHRISADVPELAPFARAASGVLGIALPKPVANAVLWFRPEVIESVRWGGNPDKPTQSEGGRLHPRSSFEKWTQTVRATALPWSQVVLDAALDLRRYAMELDLERQVRLEQLAVRLRNDVVAVVSHDLRNPINVIQLSVAVLRRLRIDDGEWAPREHDALTKIETAATRMNSLVHDLLDLARIEAGQLTVAPAPEAVGPLIEEAVKLLMPMADRKRIHLEVDDRHSHQRVAADAERIFQVLSNLLGNALKFTAEGGHVSVLVEEHANELEFHVRDDGPGIAAEQLPHLFDRYWQARGRREGSGLGLFIARGIVEAHHGRIWVDSRLGAGTTVGFSLPRAA